MSKALGASQFVKEGLPPPDLRQGPVGSVYVDNIGTFGFLGSAVTKSFDDCVQTLESAGFVLHELDKDSVEVANVGIVVHRYKKEIRHTRKRSWRLYLALKHVLRLKKITCEALRIVIGHLVHYFTLFRPALSVLHHSYKFVYEHLDGRSHSLPGRVKRELRMAVGLIFRSRLTCLLHTLITYIAGTPAPMAIVSKALPRRLRSSDISSDTMSVGGLCSWRREWGRGWGRTMPGRLILRCQTSHTPAGSALATPSPFLEVKSLRKDPKTFQVETI